MKKHIELAKALREFSEKMLKLAEYAEANPDMDYSELVDEIQDDINDYRGILCDRVAIR